MNSKINNYVEVLFSDIPVNKKSSELKEEMLSNMNERFNDYISEGKSENQAYSMVISSLGDVDEMLAEVMPDEKFKNEATFFRNRRAKNTAISTILFILAPLSLLFIGVIGETLNIDDEIIGLLAISMPVILIAISIGLIVYTKMSAPPEYQSYNQHIEIQTEKYNEKKHNKKIRKEIMSIYWMVVTLIYLIISFISGDWSFTWIIWIIALIVESIIETILKMRDYK